MQDGLSRSSPEEIPFPDTPPYLLSVEQVAAQLGVDAESGLDERIVKDRQQKYGPNAVSPSRTGHSPHWQISFHFYCFWTRRFNWGS